EEMDPLLRAMRDAARDEAWADDTALDEMARLGAPMAAPLDEAARQAITAAVLERGRADRGGDELARRRRRRGAIVALPLLAAAAGVALLVRGSGPAPSALPA